MLRFDPFTDIDAITKSVLAAGTGNGRSPRFMPMDLYKVEDQYVLHADLPGVDPGSVGRPHRRLDPDVDRAPHRPLRRGCELAGE